MMTGELYYIPIERATEYYVDITMLYCYHVYYGAAGGDTVGAWVAFRRIM